MACRFTIIYELLTSSWSLSQMIDCINPHISGSSGPLQRTGYKSTYWTEMFKYTSHFDPFITVCIEWMDSSTSEWRVHVIWMSLSDTEKKDSNVLTPSGQTRSLQSCEHAEQMENRWFALREAGVIMILVCLNWSSGVNVMSGCPENIDGCVGTTNITALLLDCVNLYKAHIIGII